MKYVDSNVFILPIVYDAEVESKAKSAKSVLIKIADGDLNAATSLLTWDEIVWVVRKLNSLNVAIKEGGKFLQFPNLELLEVKGSVISKAQEIVEKYGIKPRDAIHVASAIENGIKEIISDDSDLDIIKEITRVSL